MFIRIVIENLLSFKEETEFNMLTGDVRRHPDHVYKLKKIDLLKSAVIYGANGAGKSNLIHAINFLREIVLSGSIDGFSDQNMFKLNAGPSKKTTKIEIEFIINAKGYSYGLVFDENLIFEEWLFVSGFGKKEDELIFERKTLKNGKSKIKIHPKYLKTPKNKVLLEVFEDSLLKKHVPFLSFARDHKYSEILDALHWIENNMLIIFTTSRYGGLASSFIDDAKFKRFTNDLLGTFQTGVSELDIVPVNFDSFFGEDNLHDKEQILKKVMNGERVPIGDSITYAIALLENGKPIVKKVMAVHKNSSGKTVRFELAEESDGTLRLLDFIPALYLILETPVTVFIDEIDQSIHPYLLKEFIRKIQNDKRTKGQLIFTTHESNLLDLDIFRQDEIWFAEKNKNGATEFYPLSEFDIRPELDVRKGYLSGRFGAIPFLANLKDLNWDRHAKEVK